MTFGRMSTKWRIFRRGLSGDLETSILICNAAARLHNFIIEEDNEHIQNCPDIDFSLLGDPKFTEEHY